MQSVEKRQNLLRKSLIGNAVFSVVSGIAILFGNRWLVKLLGPPEKVSLAVLGVSLIIFSLGLWLNARSPQIKIKGAWAAVVMDAVWVVGNYAMILVIPFSPGGKWIVAMVAELVMFFALMQWFGIRRIRKNPQYA